MTLQLYIFKQIIKSFLYIFLILFVAGFVIGIYQAGTHFETTEVALLSTILAITIPEIVELIIPITTLLSGVIVFGRLSAFNEIDGAKFCGVNLNRILISAVLVGIFSCFVMWVLEEDVIPECKYQQKNIGKTILKSVLRRGEGSLSEFKLGDIKFAYKSIKGSVLQDVHLVKMYQGKPAVEYFARNVLITIDEDKGIFFMELRDSKKFIYSKEVDRENGETKTPYVEKAYSCSDITVEKIDLSQELRARPRKIEEASMKFMLKELRTNGLYSANEVYREIIKRLSVTFSPLFLILIGSVIGMKGRLRTLVSGISYGFLPVFVGYYSLFVGFDALSKTKGIPEALLLTLPNLITFFVFIYLYRRIVR